MNTGNLSAMPDALALDLNPARGPLARLRALGGRLAVSMPGKTQPARASSRLASLPAKWPFPAPAQDDAASKGKAGESAARLPRERTLGNATVEPVADQLSMKSKVADVLLVLAWGAMIPALMWLGAAGGF